MEKSFSYSKLKHNLRNKYIYNPSLDEGYQLLQNRLLRINKDYTVQKETN